MDVRWRSSNEITPQLNFLRVTIATAQLKWPNFGGVQYGRLTLLLFKAAKWLLEAAIQMLPR